MCGISGIYGLTGLPDPTAVVQGMNRALAHRGPDAEGCWSDGRSVVLGHRRLSIIDTSAGANQPLADTTGRFTLAFNGEIYNYRELRDALPDEDYRTVSDTEVALAAFRAWGPAALERFIGMFALALWDSQRRTLLLARDRMGIKPMYLARQEGRTLFASEVRALLSTGLVERKLDRAGLVDYLRYQTVHDPATLIEGVRQLEAGCALELSEDGERHWRYWDPVAQAEPSPADRAAALRRVRETLLDSVALRMRSDVPLGAFLSGGIDSSAIVGLMAEASDQPVHTFSVTFNEGEFDESPYSRMVAKKFGTEHHEIRLSPDHFLGQVQDALAAMDHPSGDGPNTYVVSQATKQAGITVALSGLGGDELFAGYPVFRRTAALQARNWILRTPKLLRRAAGGGYAGWKKTAAAHKLAQLLLVDSFRMGDSYPISHQVFLEDDIARLWDGPRPENAVGRWLRDQLANGADGLPLLGQVGLAELRTYMQHVLLRDTDQMSMAHALEVRVPFLDHRLVEAVLGVADPFKFPHQPKALLVDALGDLLPREIVDRPKMGFTLPWAEWMRGDLRELCAGGIAALERIDGLRADEARRLWDAFLARDPRWSWSRLWILIVLGHWIERHDVH